MSTKIYSINDINDINQVLSEILKGTEVEKFKIKLIKFYQVF